MFFNRSLITPNHKCNKISWWDNFYRVFPIGYAWPIDRGRKKMGIFCIKRSSIVCLCRFQSISCRYLRDSHLLCILAQLYIFFATFVTAVGFWTNRFALEAVNVLLHFYPQLRSRKVFYSQSVVSMDRLRSVYSDCPSSHGFESVRRAIVSDI